ncbi:hypothetical protein NL676_029947 [Syzygium grande]|nr:hypothetical protein NL676_029947 [Syzygium grande]
MLVHRAMHGSWSCIVLASLTVEHRARVSFMAVLVPVHRAMHCPWPTIIPMHRARASFMVEHRGLAVAAAHRGFCIVSCMVLGRVLCPSIVHGQASCPQIVWRLSIVSASLVAVLADVSFACIAHGRKAVAMHHALGVSFGHGEGCGSRSRPRIACACFHGHAMPRLASLMAEHSGLVGRLAPCIAHGPCRPCIVPFDCSWLSIAPVHRPYGSFMAMHRPLCIVDGRASRRASFMDMLVPVHRAMHRSWPRVVLVHRACGSFMAEHRACALFMGEHRARASFMAVLMPVYCAMHRSWPSVVPVHHSWPCIMPCIIHGCASRPCIVLTHRLRPSIVPVHGSWPCVVLCMVHGHASCPCIVHG